MKLVRSILFAVMAIIPTLALAVGQLGSTPLVVPGTELGWESSKLELVLRVSESTQVKLDVYSPGFDPEDYRSANELGDERYDGSDTPLRTLIRIFDSGGRIRLHKEYGVEPHRWHKLIDGELAPGDYLIEMQFFGNGKNALAFRLAADPQKATLQVAPGSMQTYNVHGKDWQYPFTVEKRSWTAPIVVGIYDGDGPEELLISVKKPDGESERIPTPGNREWVRYQIRQAGEYQFGFSQPDTAYQFTNTVGFKIFLGPVVVKVVDEKGNPVDGADYTVNGYYDRTVTLKTIPSGWELVRVETKYGRENADHQVLFGPGGGSVTYVLRPSVGRLSIQASATCGAGSSWPVPIKVRVGEREVDLGSAGQASLEMKVGDYPLLVNVPGAVVSAPDRIAVKAGSDTAVTITLQPKVALTLSVDPSNVGVEEWATATAKLTTDFPYSFPATLHLSGPKEVLFKGETELSANLSADAPVVLAAKVAATKPGQYAIRAEASPCTASDTAYMRVSGQPHFTVEKKAAKSVLSPGEEAHFVITVANKGLEKGSVRVVDVLPEGLEGEDTEVTLELQPGEAKTVSVSAKVAADARGEIINEVRIYDEAGLAGSASAAIRVLEPAKFVISKNALAKQVEVGGTASFVIEVKNVGQLPGRVRLADELPEGLEGSDIDEYMVLQPGESRRVALDARVADAAKGEIVNTANLYDESGALIGQASATVKVIKPSVELSRSLDKHVVVPGETVKVCLQVENPSNLGVNYKLVDTYPDWLQPLREVSFEGSLQPGQKAEHCYDAKVKFGQEAEGNFEARLTSNAGNLSAKDWIKRVPLGLQKTVEPQKVLIGNEAVFTIKIENPTDHPVSVRLLDTPATGLGMQPVEDNIVLKAGEVRSLKYQAKPEAVGLLQNKASVFVSDTPAAYPAKAALKVLPPLKARRMSEVRLPFQVDGSGDALLVAHRPPEGSEYQVGSSRLDGKPIPDPRLADDGRLIWKIPFEREGEVTYSLAHDSALPKLPEPELTLLAGNRELPLVGNVTLEDYKRAKQISPKDRQGMIKQPLPGTVFSNSDSTKILVKAPYGQDVRVTVNGVPVPKDKLGEAKYNSAAGTQELAYYGVPLQVGRNVISVDTGSSQDEVEVFRAGRLAKLVAIPEKALADGRSPIKLRIEAQDANGLPTGMGFVTVESNVEPISADANLQMSGYQVLIKDGVGELVLRPIATPKVLQIKLAKDRVEGESSIYVPGTKTTLWTAQGSITVRYGGGLEVGGKARGYIESPLAGGTLQGAVGVSAAGNAGSVSVSPDLTNTENNPHRRFPLLGSGEASGMPLQSDDGIAVKYDREDFSIGYYKTGLSLPGVSGLPSATALVAKKRGSLQAAAFVALLPSSEVFEEIVPDGTRIYKLSSPVKPGSEKVVLQRGAVETELVPLRDYVIDYPTGHITLASPLWPYDENLIPVRLLVSYAPERAPRDTLAFGAGASYRVGSFTIGAAAASLDNGATWKYGAMVGYNWGPFSISMSMSTPSVGGEWSYDVSSSYNSQTLRVSLEYSFSKKSVVAVAASGRQGRLSVSGNLRYDGSLSGRLRVAAKVNESGKVVIEHRGSQTSNRSALLYEQSLGNFNAGLGLGYEWQTSSPSAVGRLGYGTDRMKITATHTQSFSVAPSLSTLGFSYVFDPNLRGAGELAYEWGTGLSGTFGLYQKLGPANLSLSYALPNASGGGNRARFGVEAPLPLSESVTLDFSGGYERDLGTGAYQAAAGTAVHYKVKGLTASFGIEGATGSSGNKLTLRTGATGKLSQRQVVSFDANYVYEASWHGRFTLAYAYRGRALQVLTYHRMINENGTAFEGELAPTWHPNLAFQLRPSAAYRVSLDDPGSSLYQIGIGANYYFTPRVGLGGGAYYLWQPALANSSLSFSVEGSFRVIDPVWFNLGYTFGGFYGLTPEARPGIYIRLDFLSASDSQVDQEAGRGAEK